MRLWIKICGLASAEAVSAALAAGADALGFVFSDSPRRVSPEEAARLCGHVPRHICRVAVTRQPSQTLVDEIAAVFRPQRLQADLADFERLTLPFGLEPLPVLRDRETPPAELPELFLYEAEDSGRGRLADWPAAQRLARHGGLILAGGLNAENVAAAVRQVKPYGVDVSSGVESAPGRKDPKRILAFVEAARGLG